MTKITISHLTTQDTASGDIIIKDGCMAIDRISCKCERLDNPYGYIWRTRITRDNGQSYLINGKKTQAIKQYMSYLVAGEIK